MTQEQAFKLAVIEAAKFGIEITESDCTEVVKEGEITCVAYNLPDGGHGMVQVA